MNQVCLFFYVNGVFLIHGCNLEDAEQYGDFLIYRGGHYDIWERYYAKRYHVDYDFFPRGRVVYHQVKREFRILFDHCIENEMQQFAKEHYTDTFSFGFDEHYQCHMCNREYVI